MVGGVALSVALAGASVAFAEGAPAQGLQIQVTAVRAGDSGPSDPQLVSLRPRLRRLVGYRAYQIVTQEKRKCGWRAQEQFPLPGDRRLQLLPKSHGDGVVKLQVRLLEGRKRLVDTNVRLLDGGTMIFGVGRDPRVGDEALIILLKAEVD